MKYIAIQVVAAYNGQDRDEIMDGIEKLLGCTGDEDPCVMLLHSSTVVNTSEQAFKWIGLL